MAHFEIKDLTFSYASAKGRHSLENVSLTIEQGEFLVLCGKSGSGKSTLLRQLKTVLTPNGKRTGEILFRGVPLKQVSDREQSEKIGFVMQNPDDQIVTDKVWHELAFGLESLGCQTQEIRRRVAPGKGILWHCLTSFLFTFIQIITNTIVKSNSEAGANTAIAVGERKNSCLSGTSVL